MRTRHLTAMTSDVTFALHVVPPPAHRADPSTVVARARWRSFEGVARALDPSCAAAGGEVEMLGDEWEWLRTEALADLASRLDERGIRMRADDATDADGVVP